MGGAVASLAYAEDAHFVALFDGETLNGWKTVVPENDKFWSVKDGVIEASNGGERMTTRTYLATEHEYENFEFTCSFRLSGDHKTGLINSGIQYRSVLMPHPQTQEPLIVGYQADIGRDYWGNIYDENRRGPLANAITQALYAFGFQEDEWHTYRIVCEGDRHQLYIDGFQTADYIEKNTHIPTKGVIAFQLHAGGASKLEIKNIKIKEIK